MKLNLNYYRLTAIFCLISIAIMPIYGLGPGGKNVPVYTIDMQFDAEKYEVNIYNLFNITMEFDNNDNYDIYNINYSEYICEGFEIVKAIDLNKTESSFKENDLYINIRKLPKSEKAYVVCTLKPIGSIDPGTLVFDSKKREKSRNNKLESFIMHNDKRDKTYININRYYEQDKYYDNIILNVTNNKPTIQSAIVSIFSPNIGTNEDLIIGQINDPVIADLNITANDIDSSNLTYLWIVENKMPSEIKNFSSMQPINRYTIWKLDPNNKYSFKAKAIDYQGESSEWYTATIKGSDNNLYQNIELLSWDPFEKPILFLIMMVALILCVFGIIKSKTDLFRNIINNSKVLMKICISLERHKLEPPILIFIIISILYIIILSLNGFYFKLLAVYELYIYILIFLIFVYITEDHLFISTTTQDNEQKSMYWSFNSILMGLILIYFYLFVPKIDPNSMSEHLFNFYSTLIQASGTVLGIIVGVYLAYSKDKKIKLKSIRILVAMYGLIMGLSLLGLSGGTLISFTPIIDFNIRNIPNLLSIAIFESTCLLIPPSITSLYKLLD